MDSEEYQHFVTMISRNNLDYEETSPRYVARSCIVDTVTVGSESTLRLCCDPYVDDPSTQTRLWPRDVLTNTSYPSDMGRLTLRAAAVEALTRDVYQAQMGIENDGKLGRRA